MASVRTSTGRSRLVGKRVSCLTSLSLRRGLSRSRTYTMAGGLATSISGAVTVTGGKIRTHNKLRMRITLFLVKHLRPSLQGSDLLVSFLSRRALFRSRGRPLLGTLF